MSETLGLAIVGAGFAGDAHAAAAANAVAWASKQGVDLRLVAIADPQLDVAESVAETHGFDRARADWEGFCDDDEIDVVIITAPDRFHKEISTTLLEADKHVLCEKPMATTIEEAEAMLKAASNSDRVAAVSHEFRRVPAMEAARWHLANGTLGSITNVTARFWTNYGLDEENRGTWRFKGGAGTGVIGDIGSHAIDILGLLLGPTSAVTGCQLRGWDEAAGTNEDIAAWTALLANDAVCTVSLSRISSGQFLGLSFEIAGEKGAIFVDVDHPEDARLVLQDFAQGPDPEITTEELVTESQSTVPREARLEQTYNDWFEMQTQTFIGQILEIEDEGQALPTFAEELETMRVMRAVVESGVNGGATVSLA